MGVQYPRPPIDISNIGMEDPNSVSLDVSAELAQKIDEHKLKMQNNLAEWKHSDIDLSY